MTAYILTDTDYESPSIHEVLSGPPGIDIGDLNSRYTKAGIKMPFVNWLCRYHGFSSIDYEVCEVVNFEKPEPYRGTREPWGKMMKQSVESYMKAHGESLLRHQQLGKLLSSGERIKFDVEGGSTAAMEE